MGDTQVTQMKRAYLSFMFRLGRELKVLLETEPGVSLIGASDRSPNLEFDGKRM